MHGFMIDISERKRAEEALKYLGSRLIAAQEEERKRVARELHDDLNQRMAVLSIELEQLGQKIQKNNSLRKRLHKLQLQAQEISSDIHRLSYQLHPSKLDHLGLAAAVKSLCDELSLVQSGKLRIHFHQSGLPADLPKDTTLCIFRITQEVLRNCVKHSGAESAQVVLTKTDHAIRLSVSDNGCGFDTRSDLMEKGLGFISMQERLRLVGGEIEYFLATPTRYAHRCFGSPEPRIVELKILREDFMKRPRVILADDHTLMLDALKNLIEPEFEVVGTFADGHSLVEAAPALNPNVIVLDIGMPTMNGLNAGQRLKQIMPMVKLVYLTMNHDPDIAGEAFRLGASAFLLKNSAATELLQAIRQVVRGGYYVTPLMTEGMDGSFVQNFKQRKSKYSLTLRQKEVLQLLAEGRSMKEVAFVLNLSPRTVAFHKYTMMEHLHIRSSAELIEYAMRSSLAPA